jgi:uncharacterized membrane protein
MASEPNPTPDPSSQPEPAPSPIDVNQTIVNSTSSTSVTTEDSNNSLMAALTYPIPIIGIVILLSDSMKNNPFLRLHAVQSLVLGVVLLIVTFVLGLLPIVGCLTPFIWLGVTLYYAYLAYKGSTFTIPFVTDFSRNQKWI